MEIKWLEDFVTLAETSSFWRAAEIRNVTQPAFSRRIKQLETWVGAPLISRATIPAELTPAGRNFLPMAQDAIRMFYSVRESLRPPAEQGLVRFAALHTLTITFFPDWLKELQRNTRKFGTSFIADRGGIEANLAALIDNETDFFLTYAHREVPFHLDRDKFAFLTIGADRLIPVAAPELQSGLPASGILDKPDTATLPLPYLGYGHSSFFGVALGRLFSKHSPCRRQTVHESTISAGLRELTLAGAGICWLPESLVEKDISSGGLVACSTNSTWMLDLEIRLYRSSDNTRSPTVEAIWQASKALAGKSWARDSTLHETVGAQHLEKVI
ncbi:LysR family transcriptional regulator [Mesorhizobium sp. NBSH29]|uniref:LysR family transcriptional regulator n=1 Tax=Mesorhizobium sp. NBSH29 TaxID=2654249 RepID=UPI0018964418|nr:LysR family transcriptional regulator [Mesorhizobium sp. NBSH29]QPC86356.1 LysR family transcriptional regulator [Mesorhizobium sp. NBSH29]